MALINNHYIFVVDEDIDYTVESTSHPVEKGIDITDHIQRKPINLSLNGKIIDNNTAKAADILGKIKNLQNSGSLITYIGRNSLSNLQIQDFSISSPYTNWGGYDFEMTLKEVRFAKSAYDAAKSAKLAAQTTQGNNNKVYHTVKKGDCVWSLVITGAYKNLKPTYSKPMDKCNWVMNQNPSAFSRKNDFRTLQIGKKIYVGYR